jgi:cytochrome c553
MRTILLVLGGAATAAAISSAVAQTPLTPEQIRDARRLVAQYCQGCHGMDGMSTQPNAPNIAAQPLEYLRRQIEAYRTGERRDEQMSLAVRDLTDDDISLLSAYFAAVEIEVIRVPGR